MPSGLKRVFLTPLTTNDASDKEGVGTIRFEGNKVYKYVKYDDGAAVAAVAGNACYYLAAGGAQDSVVTSDVSASVNIGAGILQSVLTDQYYGWVQIKGPAVMASALSAGADGNALTAVGTTDGKLDVSAAVTDAVCAYADDASAFEIICDFPM